MVLLGKRYLKRFKNLSRAFNTGEFRLLANTEQQIDAQPGPWQKVFCFLYNYVD